MCGQAFFSEDDDVTNLFSSSHSPVQFHESTALLHHTTTATRCCFRIASKWFATTSSTRNL